MRSTTRMSEWAFETPRIGRLGLRRGGLGLVLTVAMAGGWGGDRAAEAQQIRFDLPPTAVAVEAELPADRTSFGGEVMRVDLRLSSLIAGDRVPDIDRWMIRCVPRDSAWRVVDYSPKTEAASAYASPIQVKTTDEESRAGGVSVDGAYGHMVSAHLGADRGEKQIETLEFDRHSPLHTVTAAGTILRGRGAFFKLHWTAEQILEGEKQFSVTFDVPPGFRGGLVDVYVTAHARPDDPGLATSLTNAWSELPEWFERQKSSQGSWEQAGWHGDGKGAPLLGKAHFVVAVYRQGDDQAWQIARQLSSVEVALRQAAGAGGDKKASSLPKLIRHVAAKWDPDSDPARQDWVDRLVAGTADPYVDSAIRRQPVDVRVRAIDYADLRRELLSLGAVD